MKFLHQKHPESFFFQKIVKSKKFDKNSMQDNRENDQVLLCLDSGHVYYTFHLIINSIRVIIEN